MTKEAKREWKVSFEMKESIVDQPEPSSRCRVQQEITRTIGRAIGSIPPQLEGLKIVNYQIQCDDKEQPEAACLELRKKRGHESG
ncbi:MAG: hypothetical protein U9N61_00220 [Euryarchaeota archaeon]|nr:hypothetical protein [Euryarchaeota archaeon]